MENDANGGIDRIATIRRLSLNSVETLPPGDKSDGNDIDSLWELNFANESIMEDADGGQQKRLIESMSESERQVLRIAASLGSLDKRLLEACCTNTERIDVHLSNALKNGLIIHGSQDKPSFSSTAVQQTLYQSIQPQTERVRTHLNNGRRLIKNLARIELEEHYFVVLRQFHLGMDRLTSQEERYSVATLCLRAGELAVSKGDFGSASKYLNLGIALLGPNTWRDEYDLTLALYNDAAEVEYSKSNFDLVETLVSTIFDNARCFKDTLRAHAARIYALSSQYEMTRAVEESLNLLERLGEPLPSDPQTFHFVIEFVRTKRLLRNKTNEMILRMPLMTNPDKIAASQILNLMFPSTFRTKPLLFALVVLKLVQLTAKHGLNAVSAVGFGNCGSILCVFSSQIEPGYRYGQLALSLLDKFEAKEFVPRVYLGVFGHTGSYKLPLQEIYPHFERALNIALETGDTEYALNTSNIYCAYIHHSGDSLVLLEKRALDFYRCPAFQRQEFSLLPLRCMLQLIHNLTGRSANPLKLSGEFLDDETQILTLAIRERDVIAADYVHFFSLLVAYVFNEYEAAAAKVGDMVRIVRPPFLHPTMSCPFTFHSLALIAVCNQQSWYTRRKMLSTARGAIRKLKTLSLYTPENCIGKLYLLQAEVMAVDGREEIARCKYASAIGAFSEFGDKMMCAIASERAGMFFRKIGDQTAATRYFHKACKAYEVWGATAKVEQLERKLASGLSLRKNEIA